MILHFSVSVNSCSPFYYVCTHLYVLDLSMFSQKRTKREEEIVKKKEKKSPF